MPQQTQARPMAAPPPPVHQKRQVVDFESFQKVAKDVNTVAANLRILEERFSLMRNRSQVTESSMIDLERSAAKDLKSLNDDITDLKHDLKDILDKLRLIDSEMKNLTRREEFKVAERYLDMWQPMEFVTRAELERLLAERSSKKGQKPVPKQSLFSQQ